MKENKAILLILVAYYIPYVFYIKVSFSKYFKTVRFRENFSFRADKNMMFLSL